jgi:glycosyltransferase involved in cell wall biosynthesis
MKIIIIGPAYPYRGGIAAFSERLAHEFLSEGHDATIITFSLQYPSFLFPGKTQYVTGEPPADLKILRRINSINPFNWISAARNIRKQKPDLLIFKYWLPFMAPCFGTIARIVRRNRHTKIISVFHNVIPHEKRAGDKMFTKYFIKAIDGAIAMSKTTLNDISVFRKDIPAKLTPHPVYDNFGQAINRDEAIKMLGLDGSFSYILFFGFVRKYKGLDLLIDAFANNELKNRNIKLIIAGEFYDDFAFYKNKVAAYGLENEVLFFDRFINDNEVPAFFSAADIVAQPYRSATQSGVTQIAYHFGKPMIVTNVGGLSEIVPDGKCGYVVEPDPDSIYRAISDFIANNRLQEFSENVKEEKKKYSWSAMTASLIDVYNF